MNIELAQILKELETELPPRPHLYHLSNLEREDVAQVREIWATLPEDRRLDVIQTLAEIAEQDFETNFGQMFRISLDDPHPEVRRHAVDGLWEDHDVRLVPLLATLLAEDAVPEVRAAAATSLGRFLLLGELGKIRPTPHRQAYDALLVACQALGETIEVHRRALESIAYSEEDTVISLIEEAYRNADERMRISAVFAMGRNADDRWTPYVLAELYSVNPEMRYEAAHACGELAIEQALLTLIEMVDDVDPEVQEAAIWALGQIGGDEARSVIEACARGSDEVKRTAAVDALRELEFLHGDLGALLLPFDLDEGEDDEDEL
ncbi:MAG: HEAT repeat domain-containing protein [Anaerolineae bacterium]|nr:HEAT repeat domain-containing protein [Anaerolineae bacterium]